MAAAAAIVFLAGCAKDLSYAPETDPSDTGIAPAPENVFSVKVKVNSPAANTRTVFDGTDYSVEWEAEDALGIVISDGTDSKLYKFTTADGSDIFSTDEFAPEEGVNYTYYALYPYDESFTVTDGKSSESVNIVSGTQKAAGDASHIDTPMYGKAQAAGTEAPEIVLSHLAAVIKAEVVNSTDAPLTVSDVTLSAPGKVLSGTYSVDFETGNLTAGTEEAVAGVSAEGVSIEAGGSGTFFIACAAFSAENAEISVNGSAYGIVKSGLNFVAGKVYSTKVYCAPYMLRGIAFPSGVSPVMTQTLENESVYAWRAELPAGNLKISLPDGFVKAGNTGFGQVSDYSTDSEGSVWTISESGTYRIVLNTESSTVTVYDPETDLKNKTVTFKRTSGEGEANDNCTEEVTTLYIFGKNTYSSGSRPEGAPYILTQSLANPRIFVYKGDALRQDNIKFLVSDNWNNEYAFGAGDSGERNNDEHIPVTVGEKITPIYGGQGNNRYTYFTMPEGTNYIEVYIGDSSTDESENGLNHAWAFDGSYALFEIR